MDQVYKQAIKDLLHLLIEKEEPAIIADLLSKLPPQYAAMAQALSAAVLPVVQEAEAKLVDSI